MHKQGKSKTNWQPTEQSMRLKEWENCSRENLDTENADQMGLIRCPPFQAATELALP